MGWVVNSRQDRFLVRRRVDLARFDGLQRDRLRVAPIGACRRLAQSHRGVADRQRHRALGPARPAFELEADPSRLGLSGELIEQAQHLLAFVIFPAFARARARQGAIVLGANQNMGARVRNAGE